MYHPYSLIDHSFSEPLKQLVSLSSADNQNLAHYNPHNAIAHLCQTSDYAYALAQHSTWTHASFRNTWPYTCFQRCRSKPNFSRIGYCHCLEWSIPLILHKSRAELLKNTFMIQSNSRRPPYIVLVVVPINDWNQVPYASTKVPNPSISTNKLLLNASHNWTTLALVRN